MFQYCVLVISFFVFQGILSSDKIDLYHDASQLNKILSLYAKVKNQEKNGVSGTNTIFFVDTESIKNMSPEEISKLKNSFYRMIILESAHCNHSFKIARENESNMLFASNAIDSHVLTNRKILSLALSTDNALKKQNIDETSALLNSSTQKQTNNKTTDDACCILF